LLDSWKSIDMARNEEVSGVFFLNKC
jgi:hypothetical protein